MHGMYQDWRVCIPGMSWSNACCDPWLQEALAAAVDGRSSVEGNPWGPKARPPSWGLQEHIGAMPCSSVVA